MLGRLSFRDLVEACEENGQLPISCIIPESSVNRPDTRPYSSGAFSRVWKGEYEDGEKRETVAIKVLEHRTAGALGIKKVSSLDVLFSHDKT